MAPMTPAVDVDIAEKAYRMPAGGRSVTALRDCRFEVEGGAFVALVGPSGCGKTTLLNLIAGIDRDFAGRVRLAARADGTAARIGYVFQSPRLLPWRTIAENIRLVLPDAVDAGVIDPLLAEMGLQEWRDAFPGQLSLGMARRAAVARAFAIAPDLLLMDEPFVSLDDATADRLKALLLELWQARPTTVLLVTHDLGEALMLADRILLLSASPARILDSVAVPLARGDRDAAAIAGLDDEIAARHRRLMAALAQS